MSPTLHSYSQPKWLQMGKSAVLLFLAAMLLVFYFFIIFGFAISRQYPIDFITFREIGQRWLTGQEIYLENSYYPMPMVAIFAVLAWLPEQLAYILWIGWRLVVSIAITRNFWILAFSPQVNSQSSGFGMLGYWGYRRWPEGFLGGAFLSLTLLKPQLAVFPLAWAGWKWMKSLRTGEHSLRSLAGFLLFATAMYLPSFIVYPTWMLDWLGNLREIRGRALAGLVPRILFYFQLPTFLFYSILLILFLVACVWLARRKWINLDTWVVLGFIFSPFVHDYDLIQLIPILENRKLARIAILASVPGWITVLFFYTNDHAWATMTLIAPILLNSMIHMLKIKTANPHNLSRGSSQNLHNFLLSSTASNVDWMI